MRVNRIVRHRGTCRDDASGYYNIPCELQTVELGAVMGGSPENNNYATATPAAKVEISIQNQDVVKFFDLDAEYYVDFTPAKTFEEEKAAAD